MKVGDVVVIRENDFLLPENQLSSGFIVPMNVVEVDAAADKVVLEVHKTIGMSLSALEQMMTERRRQTNAKYSTN